MSKNIFEDDCEYYWTTVKLPPLFKRVKIELLRHWYHYQYSRLKLFKEVKPGDRFMTRGGDIATYIKYIVDEGMHIHYLSISTGTIHVAQSGRIDYMSNSPRKDKNDIVKKL